MLYESQEGYVLASAFGVRGDGGVYTSQLQAAIDYAYSLGGRNVLVPGPLVCIDAPLVGSDSDESGVPLGLIGSGPMHGTGASSVTIRATEIMANMFSTKARGFKTIDIDFDGNGLAVRGLDLAGCCRFLVRDTRLRNCTSACFYTDHSWIWTIDHCFFWPSATGKCVEIGDGCTSWFIGNGSDINAGTVGISVGQAYAGNIKDCTIEGQTVCGIDAAADAITIRTLNVEGNYMEMFDGVPAFRVGNLNSGIKGFSFRNNMINHQTQDAGNHAVHLIGPYPLRGTIDGNSCGMATRYMVKNEATDNQCVYGPGNVIVDTTYSEDADSWTGFKLAVDKDGVWQAGAAS